jgi:hypothetical protein
VLTLSAPDAQSKCQAAIQGRSRLDAVVPNSASQTSLWTIRGSTRHRQADACFAELFAHGN